MARPPLAGFTLDRYVHLMDDGVGDAGFMDDAVRVFEGGREPDRRAGALAAAR